MPIREILQSDTYENNSSKIEALKRELDKHTTLCLSFLEENESFYLSCALKENKTIVELSLSYSKLGYSAAQALASALQTHVSLTKLSLSGSYNVGPTEVQAIARALQSNVTLTDLNLFCNGAGLSGTIALARALTINKTLTHLNLSSNKIDASTAVALVETLAHSSLKSLDISSNEIGPVGIAGIAKALENNKALTYLDLSSTNAQSDGVKALAKTLTVNKTLTHLDLSFNQIADASSVQALAKALEINSSLTNLSLKKTGIDSRGGIALAQSLKVNSSLRHLMLDSNKTGVDVCLFLEGALKTNKSLLVFSINFYTPENQVQNEEEETIIRLTEDNIIRYLNRNAEIAKERERRLELEIREAIPKLLLFHFHPNISAIVQAYYTTPLIQESVLPSTVNSEDEQESCKKLKIG